MNTHAPSRAAESSRLHRLNALADRAAADTWRLETDRLGVRVYGNRFDGSQGVVCEFTEFANDDDIVLISAAIDHLTFLLPIIARAARRFREQQATIAELQATLAEREAMASQPVPPAPGKADRPKGHAAPEKTKDYAAQASLLLVNPVFQRFLSEQRDGKVVDDKDTADAALKALLGIESKKQINAKDAARAAWLDLRARFSAYERGYGE
ncbi:MAG: hypothetical protein KL863_09050 [Rhizobium sp.]|nr:hypothetical protein [Rhizobium sp.]